MNTKEHSIKKRMFIAAIMLGFVLMLIPSASAQTTTSNPYSNTVYITVDSINGDTSSTINCFTEGSDGKFESGPEGDATLIMVNRQPHYIWCVIGIKKTINLA